MSRRHLQVVASALLLAPFAAPLAAEPAASGAAPSAGQVLNVILGLAAVLAAIGVLAWASRHLFRLQPGGGVIRVVGATTLGARERIVLVQVGGVQVLVGVSPGRLQTLHVLEGSQAVALPPALPPQGFAAQLSQRLGRGGGRAP